MFGEQCHPMTDNDMAQLDLVIINQVLISLYKVHNTSKQYIYP